MLKSSRLPGLFLTRVTPKRRRYSEKIQIVMTSSAFQKGGQVPRFMLVSDLDWTMVRIIDLGYIQVVHFPPLLQQ